MYQYIGPKMVEVIDTGEFFEEGSDNRHDKAFQEWKKGNAIQAFAPTPPPKEEMIFRESMYPKDPHAFMKAYFEKEAGRPGLMNALIANYNTAVSKHP